MMITRSKMQSFLYFNMRLILSVLMLFVLSGNSYAHAAKAKSKSAIKHSKKFSKKNNLKRKSKSQTRLGAKLGTEFKFDDMSINGHYQSAFEGMATVENEKELDDLLDYRKQYKDRLLKSATQM